MYHLTLGRESPRSTVHFALPLARWLCAASNYLCRASTSCYSSTNTATSAQLLSNPLRCASSDAWCVRPASLALFGFLVFLNVFAFLLAVGAEQRRITGKVVPDEYDEQSYCLYDTDASTVYGVCAFFVLLLAQLLVTSITRCLCFGPALSSCGCTLAAFAVSWCASLNPRFGSIRALL
ncbi:hypothetical protein ZWY2020_040647 [Hordeum vulgare]|nr:hypothetical protein ZWY2020_040647 [Hordeum vulgare]